MSVPEPMFPDDRDDSSAEPGSSSFAQFAEVAEHIAATTKRLEKAARLGAYFTELGDADLQLAARYFAGYLFPLHDQRTTSVGGATLMNALIATTGAEPVGLQTELVRRGDLGDVAAVALPNRPVSGLRLAEVAIAFGQLAATSGNKRKLALLVDYLQRATPLEAKYLIKLLTGDLRIGLREGAVEDAIARLAQETVERIQWVNMLTGDIGETAVLARHQQLDRAQMRLFHPIKFMLASPAEDLEEVARQMPSTFAVEDKYDGIRAQVHLAAVRDPDDSQLHGTIQEQIQIALFSRTLDEITASFSDLIRPLVEWSTQKNHAIDVILDGEIVPFRDDKILPFQELQKRLGRKTLTDQLLQEIPVAFIAYDVLYHRGQVLIDQPYEQRQAILQELGFAAPRLRRAGAQQFTEVARLDAEFEAARDRGNEGLMIKNPHSPYRPGRRGKDWLKIKRAIATLDVVVTAVEVGTGKRSRFLSDYTFAVRTSETDSTLLNIGKAYSGLTDAEVQQLSDWFKAHTLQEFAHGRVRLVEPQIVFEVTFDRVQASNRHKGGYALRFPRILRIREDKPVNEIDTLETVKRLSGHC